MAVVALVVHHERPEAAKVALDLVDWLVGLGHAVRLPLDRRRAGRAPGAGRARTTTSARGSTSPSASVATAPCCAPWPWWPRPTCR